MQAKQVDPEEDLHLWASACRYGGLARSVPPYDAQHEPRERSASRALGALGIRVPTIR
ncbi:hypothetical protein [Burkholderia singularis]|uniref:hypothetical protein n=1 Tax=Burkholderia singularis TaxID=1503053 RepID=UPI000A5BEE19|nr:hypothetical protein [Burkholderia singularis]